MYRFTLNSKTVTAEADISLMDYLRDMGMTSVKNGCGEGACGACMVIVDGRAVRACIQTTAKVAGGEVITLEGLCDRERAAFESAFASCGAVQCGFCIPGMIISAKALLDKNASPTLGEVKTAIRPNICR